MDIKNTGWAKKRTYLSVDNLATVRDRKACDMSTVSECCIEKPQNLHSGAFKYSLSSFAKNIKHATYFKIAN